MSAPTLSTPSRSSAMAMPFISRRTDSVVNRDHSQDQSCGRAQRSGFGSGIFGALGWIVEPDLLLHWEDGGPRQHLDEFRGVPVESVQRRQHSSIMQNRYRQIWAKSVGKATQNSHGPTPVLQCVIDINLVMVRLMRPRSFTCMGRYQV